MNGPLQLIQNLDLAIYHLFNGFAGNRFLDYFASLEENASLLKGGLFLALYWHFWFRADPDREGRRRAIIAIFIGALLALVVCRTIADLAPYRIRPMYDLNLQHHPYAVPTSTKLINWSSFPSDNATFFFALAFGLAHLSRRLAIPAMVYVSGWVCLPRMFLGVHYASDVLAGGVIGITLIWAALKVDWFQSALATRVLRLAAAKPEIFYPAAFLASFEMGVLFDDVRDFGRVVFHVAQLQRSESIHAGVASLVTIAFLAVTVHLGLLARRELRRPQTKKSAG